MTAQATLKPAASYQSDHETIVGLLNDYFDGLFEGDVEKLRSIFHDDAWLKGNNYRKTLNEWLEAVANRPIPTNVDEGFLPSTSRNKLVVAAISSCFCSRLTPSSVT